MESDALATLMHYVPAGGVGLLLLKEVVSAWKRAKERAEDTTEATLKEIRTILEDVRKTLHAHDMVGVRTESRLDTVEDEVRELRRAKHEQASTLTAVLGRLDLVAQRLDVVEAQVHELRGDTNPRGRTT